MTKLDATQNLSLHTSLDPKEARVIRHFAEECAYERRRETTATRSISSMGQVQSWRYRPSRRCRFGAVDTSARVRNSRVTALKRVCGV